MSKRGDDDFRVRPGTPKAEQQKFVSKVLKQISRVGGKSPVKTSSRGAGQARTGSGHRPGARLGRGHVAARFTGRSLTPNSRRVAVKGTPTAPA